MAVVLRSVRTEKITPRLPARADSRVRFQALVTAVAALLDKYGPSEITIQMIAEKAKMPTATVYHFFPSVEAALLAQARIYFAEFEAIVDVAAPAQARTSWQNAWRWNAERGRNHFTSSVARMRLLLGADVPRDVQTVDSEFNVRLGQIVAKQFETQTVMPHIPGFDVVCANAIEISDTFWRLSFQRTDTITDAYFDEGMRAVTAYLRCYLPEVLVFRPLD
jgi:AcrR family transcriptional regulator